MFNTRPRPVAIAPVRQEGGLTLIEMVIFIVVVSIGLTGILSAMNMAGRHSGDPLVQRQALTLAEALLSEIELQPFTTCEPNAPPVFPTWACGATEAMGPESGETRTSSTTPFNNVNDYNGYASAGIFGIDGTAITGLSGYNASVTVLANQTLGALPVADVLRIQVTITGPDNVPVTLTGYRTRQPQ